jgi:hypothetical protein
MPMWLRKILFFARDGAELGQGGGLTGGGGQAQGALQADVGRHGGVGQGVERGVADGLQHQGDVSVGRAVVAAFKSVERGEEVARGCHARTVGGGGGGATEIWRRHGSIKRGFEPVCGS